MAYNKTTWVNGQTPALNATNLNKIEQGIEAAHNLVEVDTRTPDDTQTAQASGTILQILNFFANMIKRITGKTNWYTAPSVTLEDANIHINDTNNPHGITTAQIGAASGQRKTGTVNTGWIRIAQGLSSCAHNVALFRIRALLSGKHSSILFSASITYGQEPNITVLESSTYITAGVSKIRLLKNSTYDQPYIEVYVTGDSMGLDIEMIGSYGWDLVTPTVGSIPTGYTSHEVDLTVGNGGIIAYNDIYVGTNKVWHEGNVGENAGNQAITKLQSLLLGIDTRSWIPTAWDTDNRPTHIDIKDGTSIVCGIDITYNSDGKMTQVVATGGGKTITWTISYDANGKWTGTTKSVV